MRVLLAVLMLCAILPAQNVYVHNPSSAWEPGDGSNSDLTQGAKGRLWVYAGLLRYIGNNDVWYTTEVMANKGVANGYASLGADGKVPSAQLPASGGGIAFREFLLAHGGIVFSNQGAGPTETPGAQSRDRLDLTGFTEMRMMFMMSVATVTADVKLQYATASNYASPVDLIQSDNPGALALIETAWTAIPAGAKADVYFRVVMINGNGTEDPAIRFLKLQVR